MAQNVTAIWGRYRDDAIDLTQYFNSYASTDDMWRAADSMVEGDGQNHRRGAGGLGLPRAIADMGGGRRRCG